jgi:protein SERAC1
LKCIVKSTRGIVFLGTPHCGADLAKWGEVIAKIIGHIKQTNPNIIGVLNRDSEVLARIQNSFHSMIKARIGDRSQIYITCFYKELPLPVVGLVSEPIW